MDGLLPHCMWGDVVSATLSASAIASARSTVPAWVWMLLVAACLLASFTDLRSMRIPNWLTLPLLAAGLAYGLARGGMPGLGDAASGMAIAGAIFVAAYAVAGGGAGDAKLMMALGSWLGLDPSVVLVLGVTICGAVWAILLTVHRDGISAVPILLMHGVMWTRWRGLRLVRGTITGTIFTHGSAPAPPVDDSPKPRPKGWFPYAPSILLGTVVTWWYWQRHGGLG